MRIHRNILRCGCWLHLPGLLLATLLQRVPAPPLTPSLTVLLSGMPRLIGLGGAVVTSALLGPVQAQAGATQFVLSQPHPIRGIVGEPLTVAFTINAAPSAPDRFFLHSPLPPGLDTLPAMSGNRISSATPIITGTPAQAGTFEVSVTGSDGFNSLRHTLVFEISAEAAPIITQHPRAQNVALGGTVVFQVFAERAATYQWRRNGSAIAGATRSLLALRDVDAAAAGSYACEVRNPTGAVLSDGAALRVSPTGEEARLVQLSVLGALTSASPTLTLDLTTGNGSSPQSLLMRAAGPALSSLGIAAPLADPALELRAGTTVIGSNNDWSGDATLVSAFAGLGAFPFGDGGSKDAALLTSPLAPGVYSVEVRNAAGDQGGVVLAEIFDAVEAGGATDALPRLLGATVRQSIEANTTLALGLTLRGSTARTFLLRVAGAGESEITVFGRAGPMATARADAAAVPEITEAMERIGSRLGSDGALNPAALLVTLPPGTYSIHARGNSGGGIALVEIHDVL